jgi:hypothetical protein
MDLLFPNAHEETEEYQATRLSGQWVFLPNLEDGSPFI